VRTASVFDAIAYTHAANYAHADGNSDGHANTQRNCNGNAYSVTHCYTQSDTEAAPDPAYPSHTALKEIVISDS